MVKKIKTTFFQKITTNPRWQMWIVFASAILLYANTIGHDYTQDDALVIGDNMFTSKGVEGIEGILTEDTFFGFFKSEDKKNLVAGGRYRPLTLVMFAMEIEFFGLNPMIGHLVNVILYGLLGIVVYFLLQRLFIRVVKPEQLLLFAFCGALLYVFHPVHTEAVANIKGRDEIMAMLLGSSSLYLYLATGAAWKKYGLSSILLLLAMLAKENAILIVPVLGLTIWVLDKKSFKEAVLSTLPALGVAFIFLIIRYQILGWSMGAQPLEMMNNPFVKYENGGYRFFTTGEKYATIFAGLGEYLRLLVYPHPLTNDYYPREIGVMKWTDPKVMVSLLAYLGLIGTMIYGFIKDKVIFFGIGFFLMTIILYSNFFFPIGTHLSERFLFMPSLGFIILLGYLLIFIYYKNKSYVFTIFAILLFLGYGWKTFTRNMVWKDNYTLFTTDVKASNNSAKALNAAGGVLTDNSRKVQDKERQNQMLTEALGYLNKALQIHPNYKNAWLIKGNAHFYLGQEEEAIQAYEGALALDNGYIDAKNNLALVLRIIGRNKGEKENNVQVAKDYFLKSYQLNPNDRETLRLLGVAEGFLGKHQEALKYFERFTQMEPNDAVGYVLQYRSYANLGDQAKANAMRQKALQLDPDAFKQE